jgi:hypothetical protein
MFALQQALLAVRPAWLHVGGCLCDGEIPWFWCRNDREAACTCAALNLPFVLGPNVLFTNSAAPCSTVAERELCDAPSCRLQFTESVWYRELILKHRGPAMRAPIVLWPYPIEPQPGGPLPAHYDLLIYEKSGFDPALPGQLLQRWPASSRVVYGHYHRGQLVDFARNSRVCVYLSDDDRGPLALAEILLSGCPAVGVPRGAPWIEHGRTGYLTQFLDPSTLSPAIQQAMQLDRSAVRAIARVQFNTEATVQTILQSLDAARTDISTADRPSVSTRKRPDDPSLSSESE